MPECSTPRLSLRLPRRRFSIKGAFQAVQSLLPDTSSSSARENLPHSPPREASTTNCNDLVRQVRYKFYETFSLQTIEQRFLPDDIHLLSTSDAVVLRILQEEDGDVNKSCQWLIRLLAWRKQFDVNKLSGALASRMFSIVKGERHNLLTCDAVKLLETADRSGLVHVTRLIVSQFEALWNNGVGGGFALVVAFSYMDPGIWMKLTNRHLLNELICGCAYYRYPGFCDKIILVNWRSDQKSEDLYNDVIIRDWPFGVRKRIRFAKHDEVLKVLADSEAMTIDTDVCLQSALLLLCGPSDQPRVPVTTVDVDLSYRPQYATPQQQDCVERSTEPCQYLNLDVKVTDVPAAPKVFSALVETSNETVEYRPLQEKVCCLPKNTTDMFLHKLVSPKSRRSAAIVACKERVFVSKSTSISTDLSIKEDSEEKTEVVEPTAVREFLKRAVSTVSVGRSSKKNVSFDGNVSASSSTETICPEDCKTKVSEPVSEVNNLKRYPWDSFLKRGSSRQKVEPATEVSASTTPRSRSSARPGSANLKAQHDMHQEGETKDIAEGLRQKSRRRNLTPEIDQVKPDPWDSPTRPKSAVKPDLDISTAVTNSPVKSDPWNFLPQQIPVAESDLGPPESTQPADKQPARSSSRTPSVEPRSAVDAHTVFPMGKPVREVDDLTRYPLDTVCSRAHSPVPAKIPPVPEEEVPVSPNARSRTRTPSPVVPSVITEPLIDKRLLSRSNLSLNATSRRNSPKHEEASKDSEASHISQALLEVGFPESRRYPSGTGSRGYPTIPDERTEDSSRPTLLDKPQLLLSRSRSHSPVLSGSRNQFRHSSPEESDQNSVQGVDDLKRYPWDSLNARGKYPSPNDDDDPKQAAHNATVGFFSCHGAVQKGHDERLGSGDGYELVSTSPKLPISTSPQQLICRSETVLNGNSEHEESASPPVRSTSCFNFCHRSTGEQSDEQSSAEEVPVSPVTTLATLEKMDMVDDYTDDKSAEATVHSVYEDIVEDSLRCPEPDAFRRCLSPVLETEEDDCGTDVRSVERNQWSFRRYSGESLHNDSGHLPPNENLQDNLHTEADAFSRRLLTDDEEDSPLFLSQYKPSKTQSDGVVNDHPESAVLQNRSSGNQRGEAGTEVSQDRFWQTLMLMIFLSRFNLWYRDLQSRWFKRFITAGYVLHHRSGLLHDFVFLTITKFRRNLPYIRSRLVAAQKSLWNPKAGVGFLMGFLAYYALQYDFYSEGSSPKSLFGIGDLFGKASTDSPRDVLARWVMGGLIQDRQSSSFQSGESGPAKTSVIPVEKKESRSSFWDFWLENPPEKHPSGGPREILAFWAMGNIFRGLGPFGFVDGGSKDKRVLPQKNVENVCSMLDFRCFVRSLKNALTVTS